MLQVSGAIYCRIYKTFSTEILNILFFNIFHMIHFHLGTFEVVWKRRFFSPRSGLRTLCQHVQICASVLSWSLNMYILCEKNLLLKSSMEMKNL